MHGGVRIDACACRRERQAGCAPASARRPLLSRLRLLSALLTRCMARTLCEMVFAGCPATEKAGAVVLGLAALPDEDGPVMLVTSTSSASMSHGLTILATAHHAPPSNG